MRRFLLALAFSLTLPWRMRRRKALAPRHTEASLALKTAPGRKLFHALQDYGGYLVNDTSTAAFVPSVSMSSAQRCFIGGVCPVELLSVV